MSVTSMEEVPVFLSAGSEQVFAILTRPAPPANGIAALLLWGGGWTPATGRNRLWVDLSRRLAERGFAAMRIDYRGVGESSGTLATYRLDQPLVEEPAAAVRWMQEQGISQFILIGLCFGARTALASSGALGVAVRGVVLLSPPVHDAEMRYRVASRPLRWHFRKALSPRVIKGLAARDCRRRYRRAFAAKVRVLRRQARRRLDGEAPSRFRWLSPQFLQPLDALIRRSVPVLVVYGREDDGHEEFQRALDGPLGELAHRSNGLLTLVEFDDRIHGLATLAAQEAATTAIENWLAVIEHRQDIAANP